MEEKMNKKRTLLLVFFSLVCAFTLAFAVGCANPDDSLLQGNYQDEADEDIAAADEWVLQHITLNTSGITREYALGTAFNAEGKPEVTARFVSLQSLTESVENNGEEVQLITKDEIVPAGEVVMDYTQFDKDSVGEYSIYVSYTHANVTRSANFNVNVLGVEPENGGITVSKAVTTYSLAAGEATVAIALDDITVQRVSLNEQGDEIKEDIAAGDYELTFFKNGVTSITAEDMAAADKGVYTIIAKAGNSSAQLVVSVLNPVNKIELKTGDEIKTTQVQSPTESMSATWVFVVTYNNGETKEVKKGDAGLVIGPLVTVTAAERTVAVAYAEDDNTVTATVNYTITADAALLSEQKAFNRTALGITADADVTQAHLTGDNSFLARGNGSKTVLKYRPGTDKGCLEIRYDALNIEFLGFGTLTVSARSTGSSNKSAIALKDADGNYVTANYSDAQIEAGKTDKGEVYTVTGDMQKDAEGVIIPYAARILTFVIPKAGVYTLCTVDSVKVGETDVATGRNTRVYSIDKVDVFDATIDRVSYNFTINTDSVKKDYIAGETLDIQGLTASFNEVHSVDTEKNKQTDVTAEIEEPEITAGNLTDFGKKATVTIKYIKDDTEYSASYVINVASPVEVNGIDVNSVVAVKAASSYSLPDESTTTYTIPNNDFTLHANSAAGEVITLGENETATYELYDADGNKLEDWTVGVGEYTIKVKVVLNKNKQGATGTVEFNPANLRFEVKAYVPSGQANPVEKFFLDNLDTADGFTATTYEKDGKLSDNTLFTMTNTVAMKSSIGKNDALISGVSFNDMNGTKISPNVGIKLNSNLSSATDFAEILKVTANEDIVMYLYLDYSDDSFGSNKDGTLQYSVNREGFEAVSFEYKNATDGTKRTTVWVVEVELNKGEVLTVAAKGINKAWLFGAEAKIKTAEQSAAQTANLLSYDMYAEEK